MPRRGLDAERVVEAAVRIADADGLDAVTLARVAAELGVRPPSLYNHVAGRDGLLGLIAIRGVRELGDALADAAAGRAGPDALHAVAAAFRAYATTHPGRYAATVRAPDPADEAHAAAAARATGVIFAVLRGWGLEGSPAVHAARAVRSALHGFVALDRAGGFGIPTDVDASFERMVAMLVAGLDPLGKGPLSQDAL